VAPAGDPPNGRVPNVARFGTSADASAPLRNLDEAASPLSKKGRFDAKRDELQGSPLVAKLNQEADKYWTISPDGTFMVLWSVVGLFALFTDLVLQPLDIAFDIGTHVALAEQADIITTAIFTFDIVLQFFVHVPSLDGTHWIHNQATLAKRYIRGNLFIDLLSVFPFLSLLELHYGTSVADHLWAQLACRPLALLRFTRLFRLLQFWRRSVPVSYTQRTIAIVLGTVLVFLHIATCCWAGLATWSPGGLRVTTNWLGAYMRVNGYKVEDTPSEMIYLYAMYWATYTMTGVGYGDIVPMSHVEQLFAVMTICAAGVVWACLTAEAVGLIAHHEEAHAAAMEAKDAANWISRTHTLDPSHRERLLRYFAVLSEADEFQFSRNLIAQMSPELQREVTMKVFREFVPKVYWLGPLSGACLVSVFQKLTHCIYVPEELIPDHKSLFFLTKGVVMHGISMKQHGDVWGVDMILTDNSLRRRFGSLALTFVECLFLTSNDLAVVKGKFPEDALLLRAFAVKLAVCRGMLQYAAAYKRRMKKAQGAPVSKSFLDFRDVQGEQVNLEDHGKDTHSKLEFILAALDSVKETMSMIQTQQEKAKRATEERFEELEDQVWRIHELVMPPPPAAYQEAFDILTQNP